LKNFTICTLFIKWIPNDVESRNINSSKNRSFEHDFTTALNVKKNHNFRQVWNLRRICYHILDFAFKCARKLYTFSKMPKIISLLAEFESRRKSKINDTNRNKKHRANIFMERRLSVDSGPNTVFSVTYNYYYNIRVSRIQHSSGARKTINMLFSYLRRILNFLAVVRRLRPVDVWINISFSYACILRRRRTYYLHVQ